MRMIYSILYSLALISLLPREFLKRAHPVRSRWLKEKLGFFPHRDSTFSGKSKDNNLESLWIHAVSVGETMAALPLVRYLGQRYPEKEIIFSTMTDTGQEVARKNLEGLRVFYMPFDLGVIIRRVLKRLRVSLFITMETELWPNTFYELAKRGIPVIVVNARISEKSFKGYRRIRFFMKPVLDSVSAFCAASDLDARRLMELGVPSSRIYITGNLKFDMTPPAPPRLRLLNPSGKRIVVVGSTHQGEEEIILRELRELINNDRVFLILAPRHPQRSDEVVGLLKRLGVSFIKRSELRSEELEIDDADLLLLDTIGELSSFYGLADIAIVGGSFVPVGGHNLLEPAYWSRPVICGRYMNNFPLAEEFFKEGAALSIEERELKDTISELIRDPLRCEQMGYKARLIYERNSGSLRRTTEIIDRIIKRQ